MSQPAQMNMPVMGGPVGGIAAGAQMNPASPSNQSVDMSPQTLLIKLNTAIYDYLLRAQVYDVAKSFQEKMPIDVRPKEEVKQPNGVDDGLDDSRDQGIIKRPEGLPLPRNLFDGPVLQDWWCQFWELYHGQRGRGRNGTMQYLQGQRTMQKARTNLMGANMDPTMQAMRPGYSMVPGMNNGMVMNPDLRKTAMQGNTQQRNLTPQQINHIKLQNAQNNAQMMQGNAMERQGSQMDGSAPRSGSPGSGDGPSSPKRQRIEGNLQQMAQGRPGQAVPVQGTPSVELYSQSMKQSMQTAMQGLNNNNNSNVNKGMNPNLGPGGAQGSPMNQAGMDAANPDFYAGVNGNRMAMQQNAVAASAAAASAQAGNGNHALQDYQMQLMLLEQQNKKRLLMARQEQDMVAHPGAAANGTFPPGMSPQGSRQGGDPSPNPNEMRGGMIDPNQIPPGMRTQMAMNNGQMMRPPPSSHPGMAATMTPGQIEAMRQQGIQLTNGQFAGAQPGQVQMMPGQQGPQAGQPGQVQPMGTPRQANTNMPPPPAPPGNAAGGQPSSPSQQQPPPTPNQNSKGKPATKKEPANKKGAANKKGGNAGATPATESEQPPTPTPATPATPMNQNQFAHNKNQQLANGQPAGAPGNVMGNNGQPGQVAQAPNPGQQPAPQPSADLGFNMMTDEQFGNLDLFENTDLDNFDFDSFLNQEGGEFPFDVNDAFGGDPLGMEPN